MSLSNNTPSHIEEMDRVLLSIVASAGQMRNENLVMKGGTLLRACDEEARYSEDLDFDWVGKFEDFYLLINRVLDDVMQNSDIKFTVRPKRRTSKNLIIEWKTAYDGGNTKIEAVFLKNREDLPPKQFWDVDVERYGDINGPSQICGYTVTSIMADKLSCISSREKARDLYDIITLSEHSECNLGEAWDRYTKQFDNRLRVRKESCRHPILLLENFEARKGEFERLWLEDEINGFLPPEANFEEYVLRFKKLINPYVVDFRSNFSEHEIRKIEKKDKLNMISSA